MEVDASFGVSSVRLRAGSVATRRDRRKAGWTNASAPLAVFAAAHPSCEFLVPAEHQLALQW